MGTASIVLASALARLNARTGLNAHLPALRKSLRRSAVFGVIVAAVAVLFFFNPTATGFYPRCLFHEMTGLYCPGCGSTRALHCLLHGDVGAALHDNALAVLAVPFIAGILLARVARRQPPIATSKLGLSWIGLLLAVILVFGVVRNIPRRPFSLLAPPTEAADK